MLNLLKKNWLIITFVLISIILPSLWLRGNYLYCGEETNFVNYQHILEENNYSWSDGTNYGEPAGHWNHSLIIPNAVFYSGLEKLGVPNYIIERIFLSLIILLILLSSRYLLKLFTKNPWLILLGSLFYLLNFYVANSFFYSAKMYQLILMPFFFVFMYKFLAEKKYIYLFYNFTVLFIFQAVFTNLPQFLTTAVVFLLAIIYFAIEKKIAIGKFIKEYWLRIVLFLLPIACIFLYHFLVFYFSVLQNTAELKTSTTSFTAFTSSISSILQLRGSWWETQSYEGIAYNTWSTFYNNPIIVIASFLILSPILFYIFKYWKESFAFRFWFIVLVVFILFTSGFIIYPQIYEWLYSHVPFFYIFREPWAKFFPLVLFSLVPLLVISLTKLRKNYLIIAILILIVIRGGQFFNVNFFDYSNVGWKKTFVEIPKYWQDYIAWTKDNQNSYVLPLPFFDNITDRFIYQWNQNNLGNAAFPIYSFYSANNSINTSSYFAPLSNYSKVVASFLSENNYGFIRLGPIDYLLEQRDINLSYKRTDKIINEEKKEILPYFEKDHSQNFSNKLLLYRSKPEYFMPKIYLADNIILTDNSVKNLPTITSSVDFDQASVVYNQDNFTDIGKDGLQTNISQYTVGYSNKNQLLLDTVTQINKLYSVITGWQNTKEKNNGFLDKLDQQDLDYQLRLLNEEEKKYQEIKDINFIYKIDNKTVSNLKNVSTELILDSQAIEQNQPKKDSINIELNGQKETFETILSDKNNNVILRDLPLVLGQNKISSDGNKLSGVIIKSSLQQAQQKSSPKIEYKKIDPTKYEVNVIGVKDKMPLVFNEDFHNNWQLLYNGKTTYKDSHFMANGYANSWIIDPKLFCQNNYCHKNDDGSYNIKFAIEYWPQKVFTPLFNFNLIIFWLAIIVIVIYWLITKLVGNHNIGEDENIYQKKF